MGLRVWGLGFRVASGGCGFRVWSRAGLLDVNLYRYMLGLGLGCISSLDISSSFHPAVGWVLFLYI